MATSIRISLASLFLVAFLAPFLRTGRALRTGAPALACINMRPLHGLHQAKPASGSQFFVSQSSYSFAPGQNVTVDIQTHSSERYFRGFLIQAYEPTSGAPIGRFLANADSRPIDTCSAATHRNNLNKKQVTLTWLSPNSSSHETRLSAGQWFGGIQPILSFSTSSRNQKRQLASTESAISGPDQPSDGTINSESRSLRQVRFRATIVVAYEEFYTGFESSDQKFDKFDYAINATRAPVTA